MKNLERYKRDPVAFLAECCGLTVDRWQAELIRSRMAKKKTAPKKAAATPLKARHTIDPIIREKIAELRGTSSQPTREQWESDQGFIKGLEWVLLKLEATR